MTTTSLYVDREVLAVQTALEPIENDSRLTRIWRRLDDKREFDLDEVLAIGTWSSGERVLIEWAGALWSGRGTVDIGYVASNLDARFLHACLAALAVYGNRDLPGFTSAGDLERADEPAVHPFDLDPAAPVEDPYCARCLLGPLAHTATTP